jgi:hypothetical protein
MEPYADSIDHLADELARLDLLLRRALLLARRPAVPAAAEELRGLVVSDAEVEAVLSQGRVLGGRWRPAPNDAGLQAIEKQLAEVRARIDARRELTRRAGRPLALPHLAHRFALSPAEVDLLLVAVAPELETRYESLYAYLQVDVTRKRPSADLALNLVCRSEREKLFARRLLAPDARLVRHRLIELCDEAQDRQPTLLRRFLRPEDAVVRHLLGHPAAPTGPGELVSFETGDEELEVGSATRVRLHDLADRLGRHGEGRVVVRLIGQSAPALRAAAGALCHALDRRMLCAELVSVRDDEPRAAGLVRDALLADAALVISGDEAPEPGAEARPRGSEGAALWRHLHEFAAPLLLLGPPTAFSGLSAPAPAWRLEVEPPDFSLRRRAWETSLNDRADGVDLGRLADAFRFGGEQVRRAVALAGGLAALRDPGDPRPRQSDLLEAGRALSTPHLSRLAVRVEPRYGWDDLVLPDARAQQLRHVAARIQHRRLVHGDWGFGNKLSRGRGLNVLFTGPSGTGKTMAAEVLAGDLGLDLYQIDLSTIVSKYIGETEKNLSAVFREAEECQTLLFFDEADALFGKRTEVQDAHDRYANIEVNYLLQRLEQYEGVVVLATNLQRNLDDAFLRRMQDVIEFPCPDEALRERIWRGHFPPLAPRSEDIDFPFLAKQFKVTGGQVKNIVLHAAFLAAQEGRPIAMHDLILGTQAELQKQGRLAVKSDFGRYFDVLRNGRPTGLAKPS